MLITSAEHFRGSLFAVLERAQKLLCRDDDLCSVAMFIGRENMYMATGELHPAILNPVLRRAVQERADKVEYVVYVSLVRVVHSKDCAHEPMLPKEPGKQSLTILVEGSHPDWGLQSVHVDFTRSAPNEFSFDKPVAGLLKTAVMLRDLWPKRKLNS